MSTPRAGAGRNTILGSAIVVAILVLVNMVASRHFVRADLTENKEYTVSAATRSILSQMDDLVSVKVFFSRELPSYLATLERDVRDLLDEFRAYSSGHLTVEFRDPSTDPDLENRVRRLGIPQVQLDVIERDSRQIQNAYLGIAVMFEDRTEVLPVVSSTQNLEYELAAAIVKVGRSESSVIGFLSGHHEPDLFEELAPAREQLEQLYVVRAIDLDEGRSPVPDDVDVLVIAGSTDVSEREKYLVDQYFMGGGKLVVLEDSIHLVGGALQARPVRSGLENLLPAYGVKIEEDLVLDPLCATAGFNSGFIRFMLPYPFWPRVVQEGFNSENPMVSKLESLVLPWVSSVSASDQKPDEVEFMPLVFSSPRAWSKTGFYDLNPQQQFVPESPQVYTLAAALTGTFTSFYADKEVPVAPADTTEALTLADVEEGDKLVSGVQESQLVVVGTSNFVQRNFLEQYPANLTFMLNVVDWLTLGDELIHIRSRAVSDRPLSPEILADEAEGKRAVIKFMGTFGMPIALGGFGLGRWLTRRREKQAFETTRRTDPDSGARAS